MSMHDPYAALRHRDYRHLLGGGVLSAIGTGVVVVAVGWEVYQRTGSPLLLGLTGLAQFLPVLLLSLPAGQAADRHSRKLLLQLSQATAAAVCLALAALSWWQGPVWLVFVCLVLIGCCRAVSAPSRTALLPQIVPTEHLGNAVTWNSSGWQFANVTGPALGGVLVAVAGPIAVAYLASASCAVACLLLLAPIRPRGTVPVVRDRTLAGLLAGVRFVWGTELLLGAITLDLFAVLLGGATALLPIYARDILDVGAVGLGCLRAAPAVGALLMAVVLAHRPPLRRAGQALLLAVAGFGLATIVFGLSRNAWLSFLALLAAGALDNVSVVVRGTLMQMLTPDEMRGRVAAVNVIFISSSNELGEFESGVTAALFGTVPSVVGGGIGTLLVVLAVLLRWPRLLRLGSLRELQPASPEAGAAPG
jgi:MFS family permease